jgi:isocitrate dehydrogenase kinase/phosphatase
MATPVSERTPSPSGAEAIRDAFDAYQSAFRALTRRAPRRFAQRDWQGVHADAVERLDLYRKVVDRTLTWIHAYLADHVQKRPLWNQLKTSYSALVVGREDRELAETFFNSITRRVFSTVGVDRATEFVDSDFQAPPPAGREPFLITFVRRDSTVELVRTILEAFAFRAPYADVAGDIQAAAARIDHALAPAGGPGALAHVEMVTSVFYRGKGAYLVGRMELAGQSWPLLFCLLHEPEGVVIDAVITDEDAISIVFGFTHSYFHVEVERPYSLVHFLKSVMPHKRIAELYITLGYNKHGKTELYRDLRRQLAETDDIFQIAPGTAGLVMVTFMLPGFDVVFKVIRDRFAAPKATTPERVRSKYQLVFRHDRAGRLVDAQEFEHLEFDRRRFDPELLKELLQAAGGTVRAEGDRVVISHLYTERRLIPLDLFLRNSPVRLAMEAVHDYGQALRDLAATNIFPGDILLKNFGVTRHGRVVFYDYDELALLTDCNFRELPEPRGIEEEAQPEPWFYVAENDLFPAEFLTFIGFRADERSHFLGAHQELLAVPFWREIQDRIRAGEILDIFPYHDRHRLHPER